MFAKPTLMSFVQKGHEPPAHHVQAALAGLGIKADYREGIGWRDVPARRDIRGGPMRWDREDELDFADI